MAHHCTRNTACVRSLCPNDCKSLIGRDVTVANLCHLFASDTFLLFNHLTESLRCLNRLRRLLSESLHGCYLLNWFKPVSAFAKSLLDDSRADVSDCVFYCQCCNLSPVPFSQTEACCCILCILWSGHGCWSSWFSF